MNKAVIASAGSGKTTNLVSEAGNLKDARVLVTTYTNENVATIRACFQEQFGLVPAHVTVASWYSVLLAHGVRPYQNLVSARPLPSSTMLVETMPEWVQRTRKADVDRYYFTPRGDIYLDRTSDFVCLADEKTGGLVIDRLEGIFTHIFVDEVQDLAGYDLELLEKLLRSKIEVMMVGDPRQGTYATNRSRKNKAVARAGIVDWIVAKEKAGLLRIEERVDSWRSNQTICDFADALYPHLPKTRSLNTHVTGHDGIFHVEAHLACDYHQQHAPVVLRYDKRAKTLGLPAVNIGIVKGKTFDRVLIFPTAPMRAYLESKNPEEAGDLSKFYVAVTRARYSVAFVI